MGQLEILAATIRDLDVVWKIVKECSDWLVNHGHNNWQSSYNFEVIKKKLEVSQVFLGYIDNEPVAVMALDQKPVDYYTKTELNLFTGPDNRSVYVTTLGVLPKNHRQGIASKLLDFANEQVILNKLEYLRLECKALYLEVVKFYRDRGFVVVGVVTDTEDNFEPYFLMEKKVI